MSVKLHFTLKWRVCVCDLLALADVVLFYLVLCKKSFHEAPKYTLTVSI